LKQKTWEVGEFVEGTNELPQGFHWNVSLGSKPVVQVSLDSQWGTRLEDPRTPEAPIVNIPTNWDGLIRLAVQIAHMAEAAGVRLPDGVLVRRLN
jgi:hypothetical protein